MDTEDVIIMFLTGILVLVFAYGMIFAHILDNIRNRLDEIEGKKKGHNNTNDDRDENDQL